MKAKILVIDDDRNFRNTLSDILKGRGFEPFTAGDGAQGLSFLGRAPANLAVIDLKLPDMSGLDVLRKIKALRPSLEAIILTGNASLHTAIEATNDGAFSYLTKPYDVDQLVLQIKRALEKQQAQETIVRHSAEVQRINEELSRTNAELMNEVLFRKRAEEETLNVVAELREALSKIKKLAGMLPICAHCKRIRNDAGYWEQIELYIRDHSEAQFSHGICPDCVKELYPEFYDEE